MSTSAHHDDDNRITKRRRYYYYAQITKITFFKYGLNKNDPNTLPKLLKDKIEKEFKIELEELGYL